MLVIVGKSLIELTVTLNDVVDEPPLVSVTVSVIVALPN